MVINFWKTQSSVHDEIFGVRAYTLQDNCASSQATAGYKTVRNPAVTGENFLMKLLSGRCKNLRTQAWWKISKRLMVAKPPCRIPQWSFKNSLKNTSIFLGFIVYFYKNFSAKYVSPNALIKKTLTEGRRVAYFFQTIINPRPPQRNSPERRFDTFKGIFKVDRSSNFLFLSKIGGKIATKTKDSKKKLYKNYDILFNMLFLIVFFQT